MPLVVVLISATLSFGQTTVDEAYIQKELSTARAYTIVLYKKGPNPAGPDLKAMQMNHLKYLFTLKEQGKISVFGPLTDNGDIRGIGIFNLTDVKEVEKLLNDDELVKSGHMIYEIHPWFGVPGQSLAK